MTRALARVAVASACSAVLSTLIAAFLGASRGRMEPHLVFLFAAGILALLLRASIDSGALIAFVALEPIGSFLVGQKTLSFGVIATLVIVFAVACMLSVRDARASDRRAAAQGPGEAAAAEILQ